jgi:hypothetical protein
VPGSGEEPGVATADEPAASVAGSVRPDERPGSRSLMATISTQKPAPDRPGRGFVPASASVGDPS